MNLRVEEKEDLPLVAEWLNDPEYFGAYNPLIQLSKTELEKEYDKLTTEKKWFIIKTGARLAQ